MLKTNYNCMRYKLATNLSLLTFFLISWTYQAVAQRVNDLNYIRTNQLKISEAPSSSTISRNAAVFTGPVFGVDTTNYKEFLKFYLPSAILFAALEPGSFSGFNVGFGDDKIELK